MSDEEIVKRISQQCGIALVLSLRGRKEVAALFIRHAIMLIATHKAAVNRWMAAKKASA